jgi:predicted CopG family antitoxin
MLDDMKKIPETIRISQRTAERLVKEGKFNESFDDVIARVLDERDEYRKKNGKK